LSQNTTLSPQKNHQLASSDDAEIDLIAIFNVFWRGKFWIALAATIGFILGGFYAFRVAVPVFPANAIIQLNAQQQNVVDIQSVVSDTLLTGGWTDETRMGTEIVAMTSRNMMSKLVDHLGLMDDPMYNYALAAKSNPDDIEKSFLTSFNPRAYLASLFSKKSDEVAPAKNPSAEQKEEIDRNRVIDILRGTLSVATLGETYTFQISALTQNPAESVRLVNGLAEVYIQDSVDEKFKATEKASEWLSQKAAELKIELQDSEQRIKTFSDGTKLISAENLALLTVQLKDLRQRILGLETDGTFTKTHFQNLNFNIQAGDLNLIATASRDSRLAQLAGRVLSGTTDRSVFDTRALSVLKQLQSQVDRSNLQIAALKKSENSLREQIAEQSDDLVELQQLQREEQASTLLYESFLSRLKEISVQQGLISPSSRMLSPAIPQRKSAPRRPSIMMMAMVMGGMFGALVLLLREWMNNTFRSPEDLEDFSQYRLLGTIPRLKEKTRRGVLGYAKTNPTSAFAEAVRNLRTSILLSDIDNPPQVIMSTSSTPAEGKTTLSLTLAQNMAGLGKKVLVLECDIRKRVFSEYFDIKDQIGFMAMMTGDAKLEDAVYRPEGMGIDILIGEKSTANAADIFSSQKFADLMKSLRKKYDYIIVDTPPVLAVPDARIVSQHVDSIIYAVRWDKTAKNELKNGLAMFESVDVGIDGLVMTLLDTKRLKRYGYSGQYGYHYGQGTDGYTNG
jgi:capsular exopolysaccharide synthesis family protein